MEQVVPIYGTVYYIYNILYFPFGQLYCTPPFPEPMYIHKTHPTILKARECIHQSRALTYSGYPPPLPPTTHHPQLPPHSGDTSGVCKQEGSLLTRRSAAFPVHGLLMVLLSAYGGDRKAAVRREAECFRKRERGKRGIVWMAPT